MKRGKNNQQGENQNQESWADLLGEWEPELFEWDIQPFEWELIPFEWDFTLFEWEPDSNASNDNRKGAESLDNKGKGSRRGEIYP
jgi:hypothetical protein